MWLRLLNRQGNCPWTRCGRYALLAIVVLGACSDAPPPQPAVSAANPAIAKPAQPSPPPVPAAPVVQGEKPVKVYAYNPAGRRDPFMPLVTKDEKKEKKGLLPPLQRHNIADFQLTGIIWGGYGYNAMVEGPDKKGYFIHIGTIIGPNQGVVKKITKTMLVVEERYKTYAGETKIKEIVMELRKKREEAL
jgi:type IV pilus assembly protein PilP